MMASEWAESREEVGGRVGITETPNKTGEDVVREGEERERTGWRDRVGREEFQGRKRDGSMMMMMTGKFGNSSRAWPSGSAIAGSPWCRSP